MKGKSVMIGTIYAWNIDNKEEWFEYFVNSKSNAYVIM